MKAAIQAKDTKIKSLNAMTKAKDATIEEKNDKIRLKDTKIQELKSAKQSAKADITDTTQKSGRYQADNKHLKSRVTLWNVIAVVAVIAAGMLFMCVIGMTCCLMNSGKS